MPATSEVFFDQSDRRWLRCKFGLLAIIAFIAAAAEQVPRRAGVIRGIGAILLIAAVLAGSGCGGATTSAPAAGVGVAGYVVPWDPRSSAAAGAGVLTEVSPVWYEPTAAGSVTYASAQARSSADAVSADAHAHRVSLAPSISNSFNGWDGALVARLVADPGKRSAHVGAIVDLVRAHGWPAVDIDYEALPASSRNAYSAFVAELAAAMHRLPARLSVTVHAKTSEPGGWAGARAQDWRAIGAVADEVRVMAYDYSYPGSHPGPIAPSAWVGQVLKLATALVPRDRIVLGVPTYGYDWEPDSAGVPVLWPDVQATLREHPVEPHWDGRSSSPWLRYTDDQGREHTVWYENARSLSVKVDLAKRSGVRRFVLWRLGGEDPAMWRALRTAR
jgi:spore germination protein YaaH